MSEHNILLESGTNEVEIAEIVLSGSHFGVNVAKIKEFIPYRPDKLTKIPTGHPSVPGVFSLRGAAVPLIELDRHLNLPPSEQAGARVIVITEFNSLVTAFVADQINQIHRISWDRFQPLTGAIDVDNTQITGVINTDGRQVLVLDLEQIIGQIFPHSIINYDETHTAEEDLAVSRGRVSVVFAEDSTIIRKNVSQILEAVGFTDLAAYEDGALALEAIQARLEAGNPPDLVVTDIEMPRLDGLSLCRQIRTDLNQDFPVIIFSSLITEQMAAKCRAVGATAYISKPETEKLIELIDQHTLEG